MHASGRTVAYVTLAGAAIFLCAETVWRRDLGHASCPAQGAAGAKAEARAPLAEPVVVVFCVSGGKPRFIEEGLLVSMRSVLLTTALGTRPLRIHVLVDSEARAAVTRALNAANVTGSRWPCDVTVTLHDVEAMHPRWRATVQRTVNTDAKRYSEDFGVGGFYRVFVHEPLSRAGVNGHAIYLDTDAVALVDLSAMWQHRDSSKLFQWGGEFPDQKCSGVLLLNLGRMGDFIALSDGWKRFDEFRSEHEEAGKSRFDDQMMFRVVQWAHPDAVGSLPLEWAIGNLADIGWHHHNLPANGQLAGFLHFNGRGRDEPHSAFHESNEWLHKPGWKLASYYAEIPWHWALFAAEARAIADGVDHRLTLHTHVLEELPPQL